MVDLGVELSGNIPAGSIVRLIGVFPMATWRSRFLVDFGTHGFPSPDHSRFGFFTRTIFNLIMLGCQVGERFQLLLSGLVML